MAGGRRDFLSRLATGAAAAAGGLGLGAEPLVAEAPILPVSDKWDMSWQDRIRGKFRAVFDSPKIEEGGEIWRAATWKGQVAEVYGAKDDEVTSVLVIRHEGIPLVMDDEFWARHKIGKKNKVKDPFTGKASETNPIRSFAGNSNVPQDMAGASLEEFMRRGGIVLACNFAFGIMVDLEARADPDHAKEARERTLAHLVPGIILQPSGFFALLEAQRAGCHVFASAD